MTNIKTKLANNINYEVNVCKYDEHNIKKNGRPSYIIEVLKMFMRFQVLSIKANTQYFCLSSVSLAEFLGCTRRTITNQIKKLKDLNLIKVIFKNKINNKQQYVSNFYTCDLNASNEYIISCTGENFLKNIDVEVCSQYLNLIKEHNIQKFLNKLPIEERNKQIVQLKREKTRKENRLKKLQKENKYFLDILETVNDYGANNLYLNEGKRRLTNHICSTLNERHEISNRILKIKELFNSKEDIIQFDTNASIYRLSYALGNKKLFEHEDLYKYLFDLCKFEVDDFENFRKYFKELIMPIYMKESTINYVCAKYESMKSWKYINRHHKKSFLTYTHVEEKLNLNLFTIMTTLQKIMHKFFNLNKFYQADIFIHESNLHILLLKKFQDMEIKTINVYDNFYFIKETMTQEQYEQIYDETVLEYLELIERSNLK